MVLNDWPFAIGPWNKVLQGKPGHYLLGCRDTEVSECLHFLSHDSEIIVFNIFCSFPNLCASQ